MSSDCGIGRYTVAYKETRADLSLELQWVSDESICCAFLVVRHVSYSAVLN